MTEPDFPVLSSAGAKTELSRSGASERESWSGAEELGGASARQSRPPQKGKKGMQGKETAGVLALRNSTF